MVAQENKLSNASGPPAVKLLDVHTTRNLLLKTVKDFPHNEALICFSEHESIFDGLDWPERGIEHNGQAADQRCNGFLNKEVNGGPLHDDKTYLRLTYAQLYRAALRIATFLDSNGVGSGDSVCTIMYTGAEVTAVAWAAALLGAIWVPLHPRTAANMKELQHVLELTSPTAFVAFNDEVAANLEQNDITRKSRVKIMSSEGSRNGWTSWANILSDRTPLLYIKEDTDKSCENNYTLIVFTSGTTSLPKGAGHTNLTFGKSYMTAAGIFNWNSSVVHLTNFPFHHIGGNFPAFATWCVGGTLVLPAKSFSAEKVIQAIRVEPITDLSILPSMMLAMQEYDPMPYNHSKEKFTVIMSATTILREHYLTARDYFNMTHFSAPYGASEGLPATGDVYDVKTFNPPPGPINPGRPTPGVRVKICAQESKDPLLRNEIGELHQSGPHLIPGYLKKEVEEFYTDVEGNFWFISGDAAVMDDYDNVEIIGRVKDMIIRGGVNISPARIEDVVNKLPGIDVAVVAASDVISGEVPVAILRYTDPDHQTTAVEIRERVLEDLGPTFALSEIMELEQLGLSDWPKTTSGKVRKVDLRSLVKNFMDDRSMKNEVNGQQSLVDTVRDIWSRVLGLPTSKLSLDTDLRNLADSLTTMQFRAQLRQRMGRSLSTQQLLTSFTIAAQAQVLEEIQSTPTPRNNLIVKRDGPPGLDDISFVDGEKSRFDSVKHSISPELSKIGLTWNDDVEDVIPLWDWGLLEGKRYRPKSMTHRHAFVSEALSKIALKNALKRTISLHPILRSLGVEEPKNDERFLVTLRATENYFENALCDAGTIEHQNELADLYLKDHKGNAYFPGILFKIILADIKETNTAGYVIVSQHSIFDAGSLGLFFENLQLVIDGSAPIERTSYKVWADMYYNNRTSAIATQAVKFRATKLRHVAAQKAALWPPQRAPGFFFGDDWEWIDPDSMQPGDPSLRPIKEPDRNVSTGVKERGLTAPYDQGVTLAFNLPNLFKLQEAHGIFPVTLVHNALALANMYLTQQSVALFNLANGARSWPFIQPEIADLLPEPVDIDGPMVELIPNAIYLRNNASVVEFLQEQQKEQQNLSRYAHAPLFRLIKELGGEDGEMMMKILRSQTFNWLPMIGQGGMAMKGFRHVQKTHHNDIMVTWAAGMPDPETVLVHADVDQAQLTVPEVQRAQKILKHAALWMCDEQNWSRAASEFLNLEL